LRYNYSVPAHAATHRPTPAELERLSHAQLLETVQALTSTVQTLQHQLEWFKRQLFGQKSERMRVLPDAQQLSLGDVISATPTVSEPPQRKVAAHTRRARQRDAIGEAESVPFFDEARVPIETIELPNLQVQGLDPAQFERIGQKISYRLAQRPGSYVVLKYVRPLMKRLDTQVLSCPPAPRGVLDGSRADVSFIAALLVDKFAYHLPLYRIDQRLGDNGFRTSRPWLNSADLNPTRGTPGGRGYLPRPRAGMARPRARPLQSRPAQGHVGRGALPQRRARRSCAALLIVRAAPDRLQLV
jgi:transposase